MFKDNSRIENIKGIRFFEEDVIMSRNIFNNEIWIRSIIEYQNQGFGFVIVPYDEQADSLADKNYLLRFTNNRIELTINSSFSNILVDEKAVNIQYDKDMIVDFYVKKDRIILKINRKEVYSRILPLTKEYSFGVYSNKHNKIKLMDVKVPSPMKWNTNMKNTAGGLMKFIEGGFVLTNCNRDAEIEQNNIFLEKGTHYLTFEAINNEDIRPYIFLEGDTERDDDTKNIAEKMSENKYKFHLEEDNSIVVKFKGRNGTIKNISLSMNIDENFVITDDSNYSPPSSIIFKTEEIKQIFFKGIVKKLPDNVRNYFIAQSGENKLLLNELDIILNKEFSYITNVTRESYEIKIYNPVKESSYNPILDYEKEEPIKVVSIKNVDERLHFYYNIDALINRMIYILDNEKEEMVDVINDKEMTFYIGMDSIAPIIVEVDGESIDLSGSFRVKDGRYIFTNTQREINESKRVIYTDRKMSNQDDIIKVYLIPKGVEFDKSKIYNISDVDNIDEACSNYETLYESDLTIDKEESRIVIENHNLYDHIIVDYIKEDSYSINSIKNTNLYEITVSTTDGDEIDIYYEGKKYTNYHSGKMATNILALDKHYIVLNKLKTEGDNPDEDI